MNLVYHSIIQSWCEHFQIFIGVFLQRNLSISLKCSKQMLCTGWLRLDQLHWVVWDLNDVHRNLNRSISTDVASNHIWGKVGGGTGTTPRVQPTIGEHNATGRLVLLISDASEVVEYIVVIRLDAICGLAVSSIAVIIEFAGVEHIMHAVHIHRHGLVSACQYIPTTHVFISCLIFIDLVALLLPVWVVVFNW